MALLLISASALTACSTLTIEADLSQHISGQWDVQRGSENISNKPLGRVAVAFEPRVTDEITASIGIEHRSFPTIKDDRGDERAFVGFVWRPFAR
jgi:hypothetical protein